MNNNRLPKIYLVLAATSIVMFSITFVIGLYAFNNIHSLIGATLPFATVAVVSLLGFGFTPIEAKRVAKTAVIAAKPQNRAKIVRLNIYREPLAPLERIS